MSNRIVQRGLIGYVHTGEIRVPKKGETYCLPRYDCNTVYRAGSGVEVAVSILVKTPATLPAGYRLTGEYRIPEVGDKYLGESGRDYVMTVKTPYSFTPDGPRFIVAKLVLITDEEDSLPVEPLVTVEHRCSTYHVLGQELDEDDAWALFEQLEHVLTQ